MSSWCLTGATATVAPASPATCLVHAPAASTTTSVVTDPPASSTPAQSPNLSAFAMLRLASPVLSSSVCTDLNRPAARPDACDPAVSRSTTTTDRPAIAQCSAVLRPSAPAPITTTSAFMTSVCLQNGPMDPKHAILFQPVRIGSEEPESFAGGGDELHRPASQSSPPGDHVAKNSKGPRN